MRTMPSFGNSGLGALTPEDLAKASEKKGTTKSRRHKVSSGPGYARQTKGFLHVFVV